MAATASLEAHRLDPNRAGSLALAARALEGAKRAQTALAQRPGAASDAKLITYLHLKARLRTTSNEQGLHPLARLRAEMRRCFSAARLFHSMWR